MTIWGFGAVIATLGFGAWWWRRVEQTLLQLVNRVLVTPAIAVSAPESQASAPKVDPMPPILLQAAMEESEPWAREALLKSFYEMYEATKDWGVVQSAFIGQQFTRDTQ